MKKCHGCGTKRGPFVTVPTHSQKLGGMSDYCEPCEALMVEFALKIHEIAKDEHVHHYTLLVRGLKRQKDAQGD